MTALSRLPPALSIGLPDVLRIGFAYAECVGSADCGEAVCEVEFLKQLNRQTFILVRTDCQPMAFGDVSVERFHDAGEGAAAGGNIPAIVLQETLQMRIELSLGHRPSMFLEASFDHHAGALSDQMPDPVEGDAFEVIGVEHGR